MLGNLHDTNPSAPCRRVTYPAGLLAGHRQVPTHKVELGDGMGIGINAEHAAELHGALMPAPVQAASSFALELESPLIRCKGGFLLTRAGSGPSCPPTDWNRPIGITLADRCLTRKPWCHAQIVVAPTAQDHGSRHA